MPFLIREFIQKKRVTILLYHDISAENALLHFQYLKEKYNIIPLQTFIKAHKENKVKDLPKKSLIITFDDGHKDNYKLLPVLKNLQIPITIFLCSHIIGTNRKFWFKHGDEQKLIEKLKKIDNRERIEFLKTTGFDQEKEYDISSALSSDEIIEMSEYVDFQSHSKFHPCLTHCNDLESEIEIRDSKKIIEKLFGFRVNSFSYPNGDYSEREIQFLKKYDYLAGITCDLWFNTQETDIYKLKRIDCRDKASLVELEVKVTGFYRFLKEIFFTKNFGYKKNR